MQTQPTQAPHPTKSNGRTLAIVILAVVSVAAAGLAFLAFMGYAVAVNLDGGHRPERNASPTAKSTNDRDAGERRPDRVHSATVESVPLECVENLEPQETRTPTQNWGTARVGDGFRIDSPGGWEVLDVPSGFGIASPDAPTVGLIVVAETGTSLPVDDQLMAVELTLGLMDPGYKILEAGADRFDGRDACRGTAYMPNDDRHVEYWVSSGNGELIMMFISIPEGADPDDIADARGAATSITSSARA